MTTNDTAGMIEAAWDNVEEAKVGLTDPKSIWHNQHKKVAELEQNTRAILARQGMTPPVDATPQELAAAHVQETYPDNLEPGMWDLIDQSLESMVQLSPSELRRIGPDGRVVDIDDDARTALVEQKLRSMDQSTYNRLRADMVANLKYQGEEGEAAYSRLYTQAKKAANHLGTDPAIFAAITVNEAALKSLAALGISLHHRELALARVNGTTGAALSVFDPRHPAQQGR
jgi:hypothetical protein